MPDGISHVPLCATWTQTPTQTETIPPSLDCIREVVCAEFRVMMQDVLADDRRPTVDAARCMIAWCAGWHAHPTDEIAEYLRRDDCTVWVMINRIDRMIDQGGRFADRVIGIARQLPRVGG